MRLLVAADGHSGIVGAGHRQYFRRQCFYILFGEQHYSLSSNGPVFGPDAVFNTLMFLNLAGGQPCETALDWLGSPFPSLGEPGISYVSCPPSPSSEPQ